MQMRVDDLRRWHLQEIAGAGELFDHLVDVNACERALRRQFQTHDLGQPASAREQGFRQRFWLHAVRSEEHTSELQSLMRISYAVFYLKNKQLMYYDYDTIRTETDHRCSTDTSRLREPRQQLKL